MRVMDDHAAMMEALEAAEASGRLGNVPVGCVVVAGGRVLARAGNLRHTLQDPTAHAEILALREAARVLGQWRLTGATVVVTLEPCAMCAGAIAAARVDRLVYGASEPKAGAAMMARSPLQDAGITVVGGIDEQRCGKTLEAFFSALRGPTGAVLPIPPERD